MRPRGRAGLRPGGLGRGIGASCGHEPAAWSLSGAARSGIRGPVASGDAGLGRMSEPEEIAGTVAWLLSPDATGVTGQGIDHNNGAWMH